MSDPPPCATRTMALWCPDWPLTAALREHSLDVAAPFVLTVKGEVFASSPTARQQGVRRGLRVREAQARCPGLTALAYDPILDRRHFEPVVATMETAMPGVQLLRPGLAAVTVKGPARFYGGEEKAAGILFQALGDIGLDDARIGIADGAFAAEQAARSTEDPGSSSIEPLCIIPPGASAWFLGTFPLDVLDQPKLAVLLRRLGITSLGDLAALDFSDVRNRFGLEGAIAHRQASGLDHRAPVARVPPPQLDIHLALEPPVSRIDHLAFAFRTSADLFVGGVRKAGFICTAVQIELRPETGEVSTHLWHHPRWFDADDVVDRVRWQLQGGANGAHTLTSAITGVTVTPTVVESLGEHADGLWGTGTDEDIHHGLSRAQGLLGHGAVLTGMVSGGRMLADRQIHIPWGDPPPKFPVSEISPPWPGCLPGPAPATVFAHAVPAFVQDTQGNSVEVDSRGSLTAAPAFFSIDAAGRRRSAVTSWAGPWPLNERWWDPKGRRLHRFQLVDESGAAWLLVLEEHHWRAEASYD